MDLLKHLQLMTVYQRWAYERLYAQTDALSETDYRSEQGLFFRSVHGTLNHLLLVEQLWRGRLTGVPNPSIKLADELHEERAALKAACFAEVALWQDLIGGWTQADLDRICEFHTLAGKPYRLPVPGIALGTFNHSTHHRVQITEVLSRLGAPTPEMCLPYFLAETPHLWSVDNLH